MGCGAAKPAVEPATKYEDESEQKFKKHLDEESPPPPEEENNNETVVSNDGTKENHQGTACPSLQNTTEQKTEPKESVLSDSSSKIEGSESDLLSPAHSTGDFGMKDVYTSLLQGALEQSQTQGLRSVRVGGVFIASMLPSVELTTSDLARIRKWCDFEPPFEPIAVVEDASPEGKPPRTHTLTRNQELLDELYQRKLGR
eukprot:TRINITY_DN5689_c0_g1_i2.p1 TRINITY_DN5689_c0_g1~~TRINITY_DN5689_c0_g1_i2.p1  ORF type:complete len:200 (+),score=29.14 TRINITY_DN5689_c0_g1_i2:101-700(+)